MANHTMLRRGSLLAVAASVALGCGGGDGGSSSIPISQAATDMAEISCRRAYECCNAGELETEYGTFGIESEQECVQVMGALMAAFMTPTIQAGVDYGRLVYHGDVMADCILAIEQMSCAELAEAQTAEFPTAIPCGDPFEGQVAAGGACADDMECASDYCIGDSRDLEGNVTEGSCGMPPGAGEPCDDFTCADGTYCDLGPEPPACAPVQAAGATCTSNGQCESDSCVDGLCADGFVCDGDG